MLEGLKRGIVIVKGICHVMLFIVFPLIDISNVHVDFKKWPCRCVEFNSQRPYITFISVISIAYLNVFGGHLGFHKQKWGGGAWIMTKTGRIRMNVSSLLNWNLRGGGGGRLIPRTLTPKVAPAIVVSN